MDRPAENSPKKTVENTERIIDVFQDEIIQLMGIKDFKMFARSGAGLCLSPQEVDDIISSYVGADEQKLQLLFKWHSKHSDATPDDIKRIADKFLCRDSEGTEEVIRKSELEVDRKDSEASGSGNFHDFDSDAANDADDRSFAQFSGKATDLEDSKVIDGALDARHSARKESSDEEAYHEASSELPSLHNIEEDLMPARPTEAAVIGTAMNDAEIIAPRPQKNIVNVSSENVQNMHISDSSVAISENSVHYHQHTYYYEDSNNVPSDMCREDIEAVTQGCTINKKITYYKHRRLHKEKPIYEGERKTAEKNETLAVKLLEYTDTAKKEAGILHKVNGHPNVVLIHDSGVYNDRVFIAMELCAKETFFEYVHSLNDDNFDDALALRHATQLIEGLSHIHKEGIAHRDLKPHNVLFSLKVQDHSEIKIIDFGISKKFDATVTCKTAGTMGYKAPEIIKEFVVEDLKKCDVFSLGLVVYFRLSNGKHPFGDVQYRQEVNIAEGKPDLGCILIKDDEKREAIKLIIEKMLEPEEKKRPSSAEILQLWRRSVEN